MSNVFNLKVSQTPSQFVKGETVVKHDTTEPVDAKTKVLEDLDVTTEMPKTITVYKPVVIFVISLLVFLLIYQMYIISKLKEKDKVEEFQENLERYNTQQKMLENELKMSSEANIKLEKEIEAKEKEQKKIALNIIRKNELLSELKGGIESFKSKSEGKLKYSDLNSLKLLIVEHLNIDKERKSFDKYIKEINNSFYRNLERNYPDLTENEKKLCSLLRLKLSSKEIASILNITPKSVEVSRYRLRKKMNFKKNDKLSKELRKL